MARSTNYVLTPTRWTLGVFAIACAAAFTGVFSTLNQAQSVDFPAALLGVAAACAAVALLLDTTVGLPRTRVGWSWMAFAAWALVAAITSRRALTAFIGEPTNMLGWFTIVSVAAIAWFASVHSPGARELLRRSAPWLLLAQIALVTVSLARAAGSPQIVYDLVARGTLPNSTGLGEFALLLLPWALVAPAEKPASDVRVWRVCVGVATLIVLAVGRSRIALLVALLWAVWWALGKVDMAQRMRRAVVVALMVAAVVGVGVFSAMQVRDPSGGQLGMRPEFTRVALAAALASPATGFGPDGFVAGGAVVSTPEFVSPVTPLVFMRGATDPHNMLLWALVSTGFVGLALFGWALVETAIVWRKETRVAGRDAMPGQWAAGGAFVVFLTAPASIAVLPLFGFVLGATLPLSTERASTRSRSVGLVFIGMSLAGILLMANALTRLPIERADAVRSPGLARQAQAAAGVWTVDPYLHYLASLHWGWSAQSDPSLTQLRLDLASIDRAVRLDRRDPFVALEYARTLRYYEATSDVVEAAFLETLRRWPAYPAARLEYAEQLARAGRTLEALEQLEIAGRLSGQDAEFGAAVQRLRDVIEKAP